MKPDKFYVIKYTVAGRYRFPLDMLRYDRACPYNSLDAAAIERSVRHELTEDERKQPLSVDLVMFSAAPKVNPGPCSARWESFGWKVTHIEGDPL